MAAAATAAATPPQQLLDLHANPRSRQPLFGAKKFRFDDDDQDDDDDHNANKKANRPTRHESEKVRSTFDEVAKRDADPHDFTMNLHQLDASNTSSLLSLAELDLRLILKTDFGFDAFLPGQEFAIRRILAGTHIELDIRLCILYE
jgi:hypothetical protein